jgi:hypothetical protein
VEWKGWKGIRLGDLGVWLFGYLLQDLMVRSFVTWSCILYFHVSEFGNVLVMCLHVLRSGFVLVFSFG